MCYHFLIIIKRNNSLHISIDIFSITTAFVFILIKNIFDANLTIRHYILTPTEKID